MIDDRIGIAGDWHGYKIWAAKTIKSFAQKGIHRILQLGDFGFWPGNTGKEFLHTVDNVAKTMDTTIYVTPGNHEYYPYIKTLQPHPVKTGWVYDPTYPHILVAPRGLKWEWFGKTFLSFGGANSIDFNSRIEGQSWWPEERITYAETDLVPQEHVDVMVAHDCPIGVDLFSGRQQQFWTPEQLNYALESRVMIKEVTDKTTPTLFFHGHYHFFVNRNTTLYSEILEENYQIHTIGLNKNGDPQANSILYVKSLQTETPDWLNSELYEEYNRP